MFIRLILINIICIICVSQYSMALEIKDVPSREPCFEELIQSRHSGYNFDVDKSVDPALFALLANAARLSPSSYNEQPWRFIFCDRESSPEAYLKALETLVPANKTWAAQAPLLVIVASKNLFTKNQKPNLWDKFDTGAAVMSFVLEASSWGLMSHEIGGFDSEKIKKEFHVPEDYQPLVVIAIGYEKIEGSEPPSDKDRLPIEKNFFLGDWDLPLGH